jgi:predicted amidophosphoribosyltransferase
MRNAIVAFKLLGERRAAGAFVPWLLEAAKRLDRPDAIAWVPSTRRGHAERGFTPARELAREFGGAVRMKPRALLWKVRETADQHGLGRAERARNMESVFACREARGRILLIDDVMTTGATADACARALVEAGAAEVQVLTVCRAPGFSRFPHGPPGTKMHGGEGPSGSVVAADRASEPPSRR